MFKALLPCDEVSVADAAILKALRHLWIAFSMIFFIAATTFTLLKLCVWELDCDYYLHVTGIGEDDVIPEKRSQSDAKPVSPLSPVRSWKV